MNRVIHRIIALSVLLSGSAFADGDPRTDNVPRVLPYQGILEMDGSPVNATGADALHITFALFDGPAAEQPAYRQDLRIEVYSGRFIATIGPVGQGPDGAEVAISQIVANADDLYLGMTLLGDPADPEDDVALANRQRIHATPYSMWSSTATNLSVANDARIGGALQVDGDAAVAGALTVGGAVNLPAGSLQVGNLDAAGFGDSIDGGARVDVNTAWLDDRIRTWVRSHCTVRLGWRDSCTNCNNGPSKEVTVRADNRCIGARGSNTRCRSAGDWGGVNTDGDVNGDDVFYIRFQCD